MASSPKTIALTVAVAAPDTTASPASAGTLETKGIPTSTVPPAARAPIRTIRNPMRSPSTPPSGEITPPTSAAVPMTSAIAEARPGPVPARPSTSTGM